MNIATILVGTAIGARLGERLPARTRDVVTDGLGLTTLLLGGLNVVAVNDAALSEEVGDAAPVLIVLGSLLLGGIVGSLIGVEERLEAMGGHIRRALTRRSAAEATATAGAEGEAAESAAHAARERFIQGFVTASLVYCVGPLAILGSLSDGLGLGIEELSLKAALDGFASVAFAASLGWGVGAAALPVAIVQGAFTLVGALLGEVVPDAHISAMTAVGGLLLVGVALRLLRIRAVPVADLLPALLAAPLLVALVSALR
nr:DUF554 domain-containing protein [Motilibacter deserti]